VTGQLFFIADLRPSFGGACVTLWRPDNAGYAYPLPWAGRYDRETIEAAPGYYATAEGGRYLRFPVPCAAVEALAREPWPGMIDGDAGPVVPNNKATRAALRRARWLPAGARARRHRQ
jgi:hypothetical protein